MASSMRLRARVKGTSLYVGRRGGLVKKADAFVLGGAGGTRGGPAYTASAGGYRAANWFPSTFGPNSALSFSLETIRARALDADRNNAFAGSAHDKLAAHIVGTGIKPQSLCPDRALRDRINKLFLDWTDESDADGHGDFYGQQRACARAVVSQGEAFVRFRTRRPGDMATVPLQVQLLEAAFVPLDWQMPTRPGHLIRAGIETDVIGRRTAYWMYRQHPHDALLNAGLVDLTPVPVPADQVAQVFLPQRIGQMRGVPWIARVLAALRDLADYQDAERVRKKTAALFAGFIKQSDENAPVIEDAEEVEGDDDVVTLEPGSMQALKPGEEVQFSQPTEVGGTYEVFLRQGYREVAAGLGLLYEQLTGDYGELNDRTLRSALHEFRRQCHVWQHHMMVFQLCRPVWSRWIQTAVMAGQIDPGGLSLADLGRVRWVPQAWPYIHPVQDVQGREMEVTAGFRSRASVVAEQGEDSEQIDNEQAQDNARADTLGLKYSSDGRQAKTAAPPGGANRSVASDPEELADEREAADA